MKFRIEVAQPGTDPTLPETPLWERIHQDKWWYAASIHADNTPYGTPQKARTVWDNLVQIDPDAPMRYRPFWVTRIGTPPMTAAIIEEIKERTSAGYRVLFAYTFETVTIEELTDTVAILHTQGALPYGVGLWNEIEFGETGTVAEIAIFKSKMLDANMPKGLTALHNKYGVQVSPPGLTSFRHAISYGYGKALGEVFAQTPGLLIKLHSYGAMQPKHYAKYNAQQLIQQAVGLGAVEIVLEETANAFARELVTEQVPGVADERGADFLRATLYAGCQARIPTCHFMLYHFWHHWNDISDSTQGMLRRRVAAEAFASFRETGDIGNEQTLILDDPLGREATEQIVDDWLNTP